MPPFGPIKRRNLIETLRQLGFTGPYSGGKHQFMVKSALRLRIPNPHQGDVEPNCSAPTPPRSRDNPNRVGTDSLT